MARSWNSFLPVFAALGLNSSFPLHAKGLFAVIKILGAAAILYWFGNAQVLSLSASNDHAVFESELWPGDGVPRIAAKTPYLQLYRRPSLKSEVVRVHTVRSGSLVEFDESRYRTLSPAGFTAVRKGSFLARDLGKGDYLAWNRYYTDEDLRYKVLVYDVGDSFRYLQYRAGLSCLVSWQGNTWEVDLCPQLYPTAIALANGFTIVSEPQVEWWIRVIDAKRNPIGWFLVDGRDAEHVRSRS